MVQRSANKARTQALNQLRALVATAPAELRERLRHLTGKDLVNTCSGFRVRSDDDSLPAILCLSMRELAQRVQQLEAQLTTIVARLHRITKAVAPDLVAILASVRTSPPRCWSPPATTHTGSNASSPSPPSAAPARCPPTAAGYAGGALVLAIALALVTAADPLGISRGKQNRHRLNRGGDRQVNAALWRIALVRLSHDQRTHGYMTKRQSEGKTNTEALRCIKRYIAREVFNALPRQALALT